MIINYNGWICLHRQLRNHWLWKMPKQCLRWIDLLFLASWENTTVTFSNKEVELKRGQLIVTERQLMGLWETNAKTVLAYLRLLEKHEMIERETSKKMSIITIRNYEMYQSPHDNSYREFFSKVCDEFPIEKENEIGRKKTGSGYHNGDQNKEINNKLNNSSQHPTRSEDEFFEDLKSSELFFEQSAMSLHCEIEILKTLLVDFMNECKAKNKTHHDFNDFRTHFFDWARKQIQNNGKRNKSNNGGSSSENKREARRGTDVGDKKESDYHTSF